VDVGITTYGSQRRVPGLRREEVAELAKMSANYYARIEQGENHQMSDAVIVGLAKALRLDESERLHLRRLARPGWDPLDGPEPGTVRDYLAALAGSITDHAVYIVGRRMDLLGGNRLGFALLGLRPDQRPNLAKHMFFEPTMRDLIVDWELQARNVAAYLRTALGDHPEDPLLSDLIDELGERSPDFARIWATHPVAECRSATREYQHPLVGHLTLHLECLLLPDAPGQQIVFQGALQGSDSAERLRRLHNLLARENQGVQVADLGVSVGGS
jgi:transcriptional regulator with XRE-family HTH domain